MASACFERAGRARLCPISDTPSAALNARKRLTLRVLSLFVGMGPEIGRAGGTQSHKSDTQFRPAAWNSGSSTCSLPIGLPVHSVAVHIHKQTCAVDNVVKMNNVNATQPRSG